MFLGLVGMIDPPREEAGARSPSKGAGIRPIIITGDHPKTAAAIAAELGIAATVRGHRRRARASYGRGPRPDGREVSVYARVNPEHKLRIVKALQARACRWR